MSKPGAPKNSKIGAPPKGSRGILLSCDKNRSINAVNQLIHVVEKYLEKQESVAIEEMSLEDELKQLNSHKTARFTMHVSEVAGNAFLRFCNPNDDPILFCQKYFEAIKETGKSETQLIVRLFPILYSGFPISEESLPALDVMLPRIFNPDTPVTYNCVIDRKHKGEACGETHDELNNKIIAKVGPPHRAVYKNADSAIIWQSLGRNLYLGVAPNWTNYAGYNIPKFCAKVRLEKSSEKTTETK